MNAYGRKNTNRRLVSSMLATTGIVALVSSGGAALAQSNETPSGANRESTVVGELLVTARKRDELIQNVPMSINAIGEDQLARQGIVDTMDLIRAIPGVSVVEPNAGAAQIAIRGISNTAGNPTVGVYLDDFPLSVGGGDFTGSPDLRSFDIERIEVLKGPQGTLYGASAMGGAIKFISNRPNLDDPALNLGGELSFTEEGEANYEINGVVNIPLVRDVMAARFGVMYRDTGGFIDRVPHGIGTDQDNAPIDPLTGRAVGIGPDGHPTEVDPVTGAALSVPPLLFTSDNEVRKDNVNNLNTVILKGSLLISPDPTLRIIPAVTYQRSERDGWDFIWESMPGLQHSQVVAEPSEDIFALYSLTVEKDFGPVNLTSISGYNTRDQKFINDYSFFIWSLVPFLRPLRSENDIDRQFDFYSQELRLTSTNDSRLNWVAGLYYDRKDVSGNQDVFTRGISDAFGIDPVNGVKDIVFTGRTDTVTTQYAAFGEATYKITDKLAATLGLRWYNYDFELHRRADGLFNGGPGGDDLESSESGYTPKASLAYQATENNLIYATAAKGFRIGGPNSDIPEDLCREDLDRIGLDNAPVAFGSDNLWNYEVGSKNTFFNGRVVANAALFYFDWSDIQQSVNLPSCGFGFRANIGKAHSAGAEVELTAEVASGFVIGGGASYTDAKIDETVPGVVEEGDRILFVPEWTVNLFAEYSRPLSNGMNFFARVDYSWRSDQWSSFTELVCRNAPGAVADPTRPRCPGANSVPVPYVGHINEAYGLANVSAGLSTDSWTLRAFVNNVANDAPNLQIISAGSDMVAIPRPRTVGVRLQVRR